MVRRKQQFRGNNRNSTTVAIILDNPGVWPGRDDVERCFIEGGYNNV